MNIVKPGFEIMSSNDYQSMIKKVEKVGRVCYKSEDRIADGTAETFIKNIIK